MNDRLAYMYSELETKKCPPDRVGYCGFIFILTDTIIVIHVKDISHITCRVQVMVDHQLILLHVTEKSCANGYCDW